MQIRRSFSTIGARPGKRISSDSSFFLSHPTTRLIRKVREEREKERELRLSSGTASARR